MDAISDYKLQSLVILRMVDAGEIGKHTGAA